MVKLPALKNLTWTALKNIRAELYLRGDSGFHEGPLTQHLRWWVRIMSIGEIPGTTNFLLAIVRQSVVSLVFTVAVVLQNVYDTAVSGTMFGFRVALAVYTSLITIIIFKQRRIHIKFRMSATAERCAKLVRFYETYAWLTEAAVIVVLIVRKPSWQEHIAAWLTSGGNQNLLASVLRWGFLPFQYFNGVCCVVADYTMVVLILVVFLCMADMFDAISEALEVGPCSRLWAQQQSLLIQAALKMDTAVADLLPHVLIVSVVVPLFCTVEVVLNGLESDVFAVGMAPLVLAVFVPFCLVGDAMTEARLRVAHGASGGPWLEEAMARAKVRLGIVQLSQGNGGALRGRGIGHLDRVTCKTALKSWFNFLQVLLNLQ